MPYGTNLCQNCGLRAKYLDVATGRLHPFCGKACAKKGATIPGNNACDHCHIRPKHWDGTRSHPFCSKTCAQAANVAGATSPTPAAGNVNVTKAAGTCATPGCANQIYTDPSGKASKYCSRTHKEEARECCFGCHKTQKRSGPPLCSTCRVKFEGKAPMILEVPEGHSVYQSVVSQFEKSWKNNSPPAVRAIYKIILSKQSMDKYEAYRASVEASGHFLKAGRNEGNENRRWHGTLRKCTLGDKGCTTFCTVQGCALCSIIRTSYNISLAGTKNGKSFGSGVYTSSTASKSNSYSGNGVQSPWKALLLNKVVVGKGYKLSSGGLGVTTPPAGYDSLLAEPSIFGDGDELIVFSNDAVRPSYLVMYDTK